MSTEPEIRVVRKGDTSKTDPFTICIVANPALESPWNSEQFVPDPVTSHRGEFNASVNYIEQVLFGRLPSQAETFLGAPEIASRVRIVSLIVAGLPAEETNSLVGEDEVSSALIARRTAFSPFLARYGLAADVAYAVSGSETHTRASAWHTSDDDERPGIPFSLDGAELVHRHHCRIPGTIAQHVTSTSLTALHEFAHALSSYSNGSIVDLYVDGEPGVNNKRGRPIPAVFAVYDGTSLASDPDRDGLGYPEGWESYHGELHDPAVPSVMDNYWLAPGGVPERCQHDKITRRFLLDRVRAKLGR